MEFTNLRLKEVHCVVKFSPTEKFWTASNRINHIIGIQFKGKVLHDFGYKKFTIGENCIYFLNQKDKFSAKVIEQSSAFSVHFSTYEEIDTDSFCIKINDNSEISSLLSKMDNLNTLYPAGNNLSASVFYTLCSVFDRIRVREYAKTDERMIKAKEFVDLNFKDKLQLKKLNFQSSYYQ